MEKMKQYLDRAEYIKKTALAGSSHKVVTAPEPEDPTDSNTATQKKEDKKNKK